MRYLDVCAGISASTVAWKPLGWEAAAYSEIEAAPRAILSHHYPDTPLHGDFTTIKGDEYGPIDLLVGGTPCQDFSIAGLRAGMDGDRGNLSLEFLRLADRTRPRWLVWENVPGVLSIDGGRAFGAILGGMGELGYGFAYRILDAQHFGVPQRRRRVFVVGYFGDHRRAGAVLFERHGLSGHPAPRPRSVKAVAALTANGVGTCGADENQGQAGHLIAYGGGNTAGSIEVATAQTAHGVRLDFDTETFVTQPFSIMPMNSNTDYVARATDIAQPIMAGGPVGGNQGGDFIVQPICFSTKDHGADAMHDLSPTLRAGGHSGSHANAGVMPAVAFSIGDSEIAHCLRSGASKADKPDSTTYVAASAVRRLTPRECERLQGFPDDYSLVPNRGKPMADGPRYKALGNSMAVPVMRWIGERIAAVEALSERLAA